MIGEPLREVAALVRPPVILEVGRRTYEDWRIQRTVRLGASLAYYSLFGIVPVVALALVLVSMIFAGIDIEQTVARVFGDLLDAQDQQVLARAVTEHLESAKTRWGLGVLGLVSTFLAGSVVFVALADAANLIWEVPVAKGLHTAVRRRLLALAMVVGVAATLIVIVVLRWVGGVLLRFAPSDTFVVDLAFGVAEQVVSFTILGLAVTMLIRVVTPVAVDRLATLIGGVLTALVMVLASALLGLYLDRVFTTSLTGAAGGLLAFLFWMYAIAQVLLMGMHVVRAVDERLRVQRELGR